MRSVKPAPLLPMSINVFVHPYLKTSSHVFVYRDSVCRPVEPPYDGPYKVIERMDKSFAADKNSREDSVSIDRRKPACLEDNPMSIELSVPDNTRVTEYPSFLEEIASTTKATEPSIEP
ncbi:unnamed protein product [Trichobilharzia regenti]|nr:unnamed protein product [Trichobilharzia regenti]